MKRLVTFLLAGITFASTTRAKDLSVYTTADELWQYIVQLQQEGPSERPATVQQQKVVYRRFLDEADEALAEFTTRFPHDERIWAAKLMRIQISIAGSDLDGRKPDPTLLENSYTEIAIAPEAPADARAGASRLLIELHASGLSNPAPTNALAAIDREIAAFERQFPNDNRNGALQLMRVRLYQKPDPAKALAIARSLANGTDPQLAAAAQELIYNMELNKKPLSLRFTSVDGSTVDLDNLRGRVVLLDFWATWCAPCVVEAPSVVATYQKLHSKGFEIVGISLDRDKDKLLAFTKQHGMTWPQYFDGKAWNNALSTRFHVSAIPAMWLLDKKGYVRNTDARDDLAANVQKLLAE